MHGNYGNVNMTFKGVNVVTGCSLEPSGLMMNNGISESVLVTQNVCVNGAEVPLSGSGTSIKKGKWKRWAREGGLRVKGPEEELCLQKTWGRKKEREGRGFSRFWHSRPPAGGPQGQCKSLAESFYCY